MEYSVGQRVRSKAGRDKGREYVVIRTEKDHVYVADGAARRLGHLKKKKHKHVEGSYNVSDEIKEHIKQGTVEDHMLRKFLKRS
ncbi:MAG: RNA-binding protein [Clostridia bacterium]|nr:RNA-binding protein [Clostridia bacterium]